MQNILEGADYYYEKVKNFSLFEFINFLYLHLALVFSKQLWEQQFMSLVITQRFNRQLIPHPMAMRLSSRPARTLRTSTLMGRTSHSATLTQPTLRSWLPPELTAVALILLSPLPARSVVPVSSPVSLSLTVMQ